MVTRIVFEVNGGFHIPLLQLPLSVLVPFLPCDFILWFQESKCLHFPQKAEPVRTAIFFKRGLRKKT